MLASSRDAANELAASEAIASESASLVDDITLIGCPAVDTSPRYSGDMAFRKCCSTCVAASIWVLRIVWFSPNSLENALQYARECPSILLIGSLEKAITQPSPHH